MNVLMEHCREASWEGHTKMVVGFPATA